MSAEGPSGAAGDRLDTWKEIAAYLGRDVKTVQRWEKREGLPVHRHVHDRLGSVYGYKDELDAWRNHRRVKPAARRRRLMWRAVSGTILAAGILAIWQGKPSRSGRWFSSKNSSMVTLRVWSGPDSAALGSVSPDGRYLAFADPVTSDLAIYDIATAQKRRLTRKPPRSRTGGAISPVFSPDGRQIAYSWDQGLFQDLRLTSVDGSQGRVLYQDADMFGIGVFDWSADGRHILTKLQRRDGNYHLALISTADGSVSLLKDLDWRQPLKGSFSPDGRYVAYDFPPRPDSPERDIFLLSLSDRREIPLIEHPAHDFLLGWSPDGKTILFASDRTGSTDVWGILMSHGQRQSAPFLLKTDIGEVRTVGFTRSGSYYYGLYRLNADVYVAALDPKTGAVLAAPTPAAQRSTGFNRSPDWSFDGQSLAFVSRQFVHERAAPAQVLIHIHPASRPSTREEERELRPELQFIEVLRWSPDGHWFLATGFGRAGRFGLFRVKTQTGEATSIVESGEPRAYFHEPAWSPDGTKIFYKVRDSGVEPARLVVRDLAAGKEKELLGSVYRFDLSRDGKWLAFCTFDEQSEFIRIIRAGGGEPRELYREPRTGRINSVVWTPDGRYLLFAKRGELWRLPVAGGSPEKLALAMEGLRDLRMHPDGKKVAFTAGSPRGEVWMMENFLPAL